MCTVLALTIAGLQHSCHVRAPDCIGSEGWIACVHRFDTNNCWLAAFMLQIALGSKDGWRVCTFLALTVAGLQHSCHISAPDDPHAAVPRRHPEEQGSEQSPVHVLLLVCHHARLRAWRLEQRLPHQDCQSLGHSLQ